MRTVITVGLFVVFLTGPWVPEAVGFQRRPLQKPKPTLPTSPEPTAVDGMGYVRYDPGRELYIFSYTGSDGKLHEVYYELPTKAEVVVEGSMERNEAGNGFIYQYVIHNLPTSRQGASTLIIRPPVEVTNPKAPDEGWRMTLFPTGGRPDWKGVGWGDIKRRKGIPPPPVTNYAESGREVELRMRSSSPAQALWHSLGVPPGKTQGGFSFESDLLPGIVPCNAWGSSFTVVSDGWIPRVMHENSLRFMYGKTVGPVVDANSESPGSILKRLEEWVRESENLGWLNNEEVSAKLLSNLEAARKALAKNNQAVLREALSTILTLTEAERDKSITSELYAILKFNAEALLAKLGEQN